MTLDFKLSWNACGAWRCRLRGIALALVSFLFLCVTPAMTGAEDQNHPAAFEVKGLHIEADGQTVIDIKQSSIEYSVNVIITLDPTRISADNVKIILNKNSKTGLSFTSDSVEKIIASGNVRIVFENGIATGREAVYDAVTETLVLSGEPATLVSNELEMSCPVIRTVGFTL